MSVPTQNPAALKPTAVKTAPAPKVAKVKKEGGVARPRLPKYPDEHLITVLKPNAKARGAAERFKLYTTGMTVKAYVDKVHESFARTVGQTQADIRWDEDHKFIHVGPTVIAVPPPAQAQAATPTPPQ